MNWPESWKAQMAQVNDEVNLLPYVGDAEKYRLPDFWTSIEDAGAGDCDDYAIGKLRRLAALGWPIEALHLACCYVETNEYHAVLVVETPQGSYMLDNRQPEPVPIGSLALLSYRPAVIQAVGGERAWRRWSL
jgi:predicted transglutaminase-like cysteine proteinase